jgi:hypothetical protein
VQQGAKQQGRPRRSFCAQPKEKPRHQWRQTSGGSSATCQAAHRAPAGLTSLLDGGAKALLGIEGVVVGAQGQTIAADRGCSTRCCRRLLPKLLQAAPSAAQAARGAAQAVLPRRQLHAWAEQALLARRDLEGGARRQRGGRPQVGQAAQPRREGAAGAGADRYPQAVLRSAAAGAGRGHGGCRLALTRCCCCCCCCCHCCCGHAAIAGPAACICGRWRSSCCQRWLPQVE